MKIGDKKSLKISATLYQVNPGKIHRINWEVYTLYAGAAGIMLRINGKFTMRKFKSSLLS